MPAVPSAMKPNEVVAPGARAPLKAALRTVARPSAVLSEPFQRLVTREPPSSHCTDQPVSAAVPLFSTVTSAW